MNGVTLKKMYSEEYIESFKKVLGHEGGYIDDPNDAGGETNWGISKRAYPHLDIKNLSRDDAMKIYYDDYWKKYKVQRLPSEIRFCYFDMSVNMGGSRACKILQKTCNAKGSKLDVDGRIGSKTIGASKMVSFARLRAYRVLHYASIVINKPSQEKYWYGWFKRSL